MAAGARRMYTVRRAIAYTRRAIIMMRAVRRVSIGSIRAAVIIITGVRVGRSGAGVAREGILGDR